MDETPTLLELRLGDLETIEELFAGLVRREEKTDVVGGFGRGGGGRDFPRSARERTRWWMVGERDGIGRPRNDRRPWIRWEKSTAMFQGFVNLTCALLLMNEVRGWVLGLSFERGAGSCRTA